MYGERLNRVVIELPNIISIEPYQQSIIIDREINGMQRLIELHVSQDETNEIVKELLNQGATIKLLEPLQRKEKEYLGYFKGEEKI